MSSKSFYDGVNKVFIEIPENVQKWCDQNGALVLSQSISDHLNKGNIIVIGGKYPHFNILLANEKFLKSEFLKDEIKRLNKQLKKLAAKPAQETK